MSCEDQVDPSHGFVRGRCPNYAFYLNSEMLQINLQHPVFFMPTK